MGDDSDLIQKHIKTYNLQDTVTLTGSVPHSTAIDYMNKADVLLLYQENTSAQVSAVAGKTYEYLRTGKAILGIVPEGDNYNIIEQYATQYELVTDYDKSSIHTALESLYENWHEGKLSTNSVPNENYKKHYNRRVLTHQLAKAFDSITKKIFF